MPYNVPPFGFTKLSDVIDSLPARKRKAAVGHWQRKHPQIEDRWEKRSQQPLPFVRSPANRPGVVYPTSSSSSETSPPASQVVRVSAEDKRPNWWQRFLGWLGIGSSPRQQQSQQSPPKPQPPSLVGGLQGAVRQRNKDLGELYRELKIPE